MIPAGASKFLGMPDLPVGQPWPTRSDGQPLNSLAQINFAELDGARGDVPLPTSGLALFFIDYSNPPWGDEPEDADGFRVIFTPDVKNTVRTEVPPQADYSGLLYDTKPTPQRLTFDSVVTYPGPDHELLEDTDAGDAAENIREAIYDGDNDDPEPMHQLYGHAKELQSPMEWQAQLSSNGINVSSGEPFPKDRQRAEELEDSIGDWVLLFQIDSDAIFNWGDAGAIFFWIRKQDLAAQDFSKTWMILQCG